MTIVHIVYGLPIGGIETMLVNIVNQQALFGHYIHVIVINSTIEESLASRFNRNIILHRLNRKKGSRNPLPLMKMNYKLWKINPDVVHLHLSSISKYIFIPSLKRKLCVTLHSLCNEDNTKNIGKSGPIFAISDSVKQDIKEKLDLNAITVTNGIDISQIRPKEDYNSRGDSFKIVQVGRLNHLIKGQDILIRAVSKLINSGRNVSLTLIGDGESRAELKKLVTDLGLTNNIIFLGSQTQEFVLSHLADYDLFVQPSRFEGFGLTVAEAMAAGLPVLVSDNNGPVEIIENGHYGYIFKCGDWIDCAAGIAKIMAEYPDNEFLNAAKLRIEALYTVQSTAARYIKLYEQRIMK